MKYRGVEEKNETIEGAINTYHSFENHSDRYLRERILRCSRRTIGEHHPSTRNQSVELKTNEDNPRSFFFGIHSRKFAGRFIGKLVMVISLMSIKSFCPVINNHSHTKIGSIDERFFFPSKRHSHDDSSDQIIFLEKYSFLSRAPSFRAIYFRTFLNRNERMGDEGR